MIEKLIEMNNKIQTKREDKIKILREESLSKKNSQIILPWITDKTIENHK